MHIFGTKWTKNRLAAERCPDPQRSQ